MMVRAFYCARHLRCGYYYAIRVTAASQGNFRLGRIMDCTRGGNGLYSLHAIRGSPAAAPGPEGLVEVGIRHQPRVPSQGIASQEGCAGLVELKAEGEEPRIYA